MKKKCVLFLITICLILVNTVFITADDLQPSITIARDNASEKWVGETILLELERFNLKL